MTVKSLQLELEASEKMTFVMRFFITTLLGILLYVVALNVVIRYLSVVKTSTVITVPFLIAFLLMYSYVLKFSRMPKSFFGLTTANWRMSLKESLLYTIPIMILLMLLKWLAIHYIPRYATEPLFNPFSPFHGKPATVLLLIFFVSTYAFFSVIQELLVRGIVQGSLEYFLQGRHKTLLAILLANIIFSVLHVHIAPIFSLLVFLPGLLWGYLYARQKTLIGACVSHVLIGVWIGFVLGIDFVFK